MRQVRTSGSAYDLGYHVVWCLKYRRPVLGGRVKSRYVDTRYERPGKGGGRA
ncbi:transposase [Nonomuraea sp. NPDC048916]|uniref:transposase n=1 Tax=Nonomuraea sp. NPDC048916 TaxID=3154232 RepID=UPI0033CFA1E6